MLLEMMAQTLNSRQRTMDDAIDLDDEEAVNELNAPRIFAPNHPFGPFGPFASAMRYEHDDEPQVIMRITRIPNEPVNSNAPPPSILPPKIDNEPSALPTEGKCLICQDRARKTVVVPCGHSYSCVTCFHNNATKRTCAICRKDFDKVIPLYIQSDDTENVV
jgi:hypothetical protein